MSDLFSSDILWLYVAFPVLSKQAGFATQSLTRHREGTADQEIFRQHLNRYCRLFDKF